MTEETNKELGKLQERHSELCARAADNGVKVPEALTVDFDTVEDGSSICDQLEKLIADAGVANASEGVQSTPAKARAKKKATATKPVQTDEAQQESDTMAKTAKKTKTKKATSKAAPKKGAAKKVAKKAATKKAKAPRGDTKVSKVIAKLKNGGITRKEVLKMTGWKAVSMQQLAKAAGLTIKKSEERPFRYTAK